MNAYSAALDLVVPNGFTVAGTLTLPSMCSFFPASAGTVHITGVLHLPSGAEIVGALDNSGTLDVSGGTLRINSVTVNTGSISVADGAAVSTYDTFTQTAGSTMLHGSSSSLTVSGGVFIAGGRLGGRTTTRKLAPVAE